MVQVEGNVNNGYRNGSSEDSSVISSNGHKSLQELKEVARAEPGLRAQTMSLNTINPYILSFRAMEYAARGPVILRTLEIEQELLKGVKKPFTEVIKANLGDAQAMGQKPITFLRQLLAVVTCPELMEDSKLPEDVKERALSILRQCRGTSIGAYTDSRGLDLIRRHVAEYIMQRDGGIPATSENIILSAGASDGIRACLKLLKSSESGRKSGVMTPIPEYPLYNATLGEYNMQQIGYYLDESQGWGVNIPELQRAISEARKTCEPRAIVIINPGNPTGQVLSRKNIEDIIQFAYREKLVIFADEVYQDNVFEKSQFISFKKVLMEMPSPLNSVELFSFFSCSKGYVCECGIRGAYLEMTNIDAEVKSVLNASVAAKLSPTIHGQVAVECAVNPPKKGEASYELYTKEKTSILQSLEMKARMVETAFNALPGISCSAIQGAMYAFPQVSIPEKAIQAARCRNLEPDVFYALELVENTGICVVPGSGMGQLPGTYHFRTTLLPHQEKLKYMLTRFSEFHLEFLGKYSD